MIQPTLHRLLWGPVPENSTLADWRIRTWEVPAIGLPTRVATRLFLAAQENDELFHTDWNAVHGPLTWQLESGREILSVGRRSQFGFENTSSVPISHSVAEQPQVRRSIAWESTPHAAYFLPFVVADEPCHVNRDGYAIYCDVLLLLTAMDGGEAILDRLAERGAGTVPFEDQWAWRSRIHLPMKAWQQIEQAFRWTEAPEETGEPIRESLIQTLTLCAPEKLTLEDFVIERIDLRLETTSDAEVVRTVRPPDSPDTDLPDELLLDRRELKESLIVRIGQVAVWPDRDSVVNNFPAMDSASANHVMEQVASAFQSPSSIRDERGPELVLFPELTIPREEVRTVRDLVASTGRASLAGLYWRELPPVYRAFGSTLAARRWFVNEAELVIPMDHGKHGPTSVRWYRVRKQIPAHIETGLAQELTARSQGTSWEILKGQRWYRFVHPQWGDFTIAICADLLDAGPWRSLRGELLHLFMVAFNEDVDLYDSLTWIRAYENYVNLVAVNHGSFGGSFLWTPRRSHGHELARLRGRKLFLVADVDVPVKGLVEAQLNGVQKAVESAAYRWAGNKRQLSEFKSPPPGFERRAL